MCIARLEWTARQNVKMKLGDAIATVAQPIARGIDRVAGTDIQNCSGCKGRQATLNRLSDSMFDFLWNKNREGGKMQFIITKQIAVEAETPEEAISKIAAGQTISLSVTQRPQPQVQQVRPPIAPKQG